MAHHVLISVVMKPTQFAGHTASCLTNRYVLNDTILTTSDTNDICRDTKREVFLIVELTRYTAVDGKGAAVKTRFIEKALPLLESLGATLIGVFSAPASPDELTYMLRFTDQKHREDVWARFFDDAGWIEVKARSEKDGPLIKQKQTDILKVEDVASSQLTTPAQHTSRSASGAQ